MASNLQTYNSNRRLGYWAKQIRQCKESGLSVAKWCEAHHIRKSNYYCWQKPYSRLPQISRKTNRKTNLFSLNFRQQNLKRRITQRQKMCSPFA